MALFIQRNASSVYLENQQAATSIETCISFVSLTTFPCLIRGADADITLFTLRKTLFPLILNGEQGLLKVNRCVQLPRLLLHRESDVSLPSCSGPVLSVDHRLTLASSSSDHIHFVHPITLVLYSIYSWKIRQWVLTALALLFVDVSDSFL